MGKHYGQLDLNERIEHWRHHNAGTALSEFASIMGRHSWKTGMNSDTTVYQRLAKNQPRRTEPHSRAVGYIRRLNAEQVLGPYRRPKVRARKLHCCLTHAKASQGLR